MNNIAVFKNNSRHGYNWSIDDMVSKCGQETVRDCKFAIEVVVDWGNASGYSHTDII